MMFYQNRFPKHPYFWGSPNGWPGTVVRKQGEIISKCVIKKLQKYKHLFLILVSGKLSTNVCVINTCFAEIAASNWSFSSDVLIISWYFHFPVKLCNQACCDQDFN